MLFACLAAVLAVTGATPQESGAPVTFLADERELILRLSPLPPPPDDPSNAVYGNEDAADLGQALFHETRLSPSGTISCATCHDPARGFADGRALGSGLADLPRHTPTLWNVAYQRWFFWDGRADSLWSQALGPIENPREMGSHRWWVAETLRADAGYRARFEQLFGRFPDFPAAPDVGGREGAFETLCEAYSRLPPAQQRSIDEVFVRAGKCIAAFERKLVSREAAFDRFVQELRRTPDGPFAALSLPAQRGLKLFVGRADCIRCHQGAALSDGEFHSIRVAPLGGGPPLDAGRYQGIKDLQESPFSTAGIHSDDPGGKVAARLRFLRNSPENWGAFRTPSLRNVSLTAPYMHQGQLATLRDVVHFYSTFEGALPPGHHPEAQLLRPLHLEAQEQEDLIAFLQSLTDAPLDPAWAGPPDAITTPQPPETRR